MKKLVALILTLAMMLCVGTAFATEAEPEQTGAIEINWADLEEQGAETIAQGDFVTFDEIAVKMWMPNALAAVELTDDDKAQGYIGYYQPEDGSAAIAVMYVDANGMTLDEYKEECPAFEADIYGAISMKTCVERRLTLGAPGEAVMRQVIAENKAYLEREAPSCDQK